MKRTLVFLLVFLVVQFDVIGQVFYSQSFESLAGWTLSHTFDDGGNDFCKRDSLTNTAFAGLDFLIIGGDGDWAIGAENTEVAEPGAPADGIVILTVEPVNISGLSNLEMVVSIACNAAADPFDDREALNGDFLDFEYNIDGTGWFNFGQFNSADSLAGDSELYFDINQNGNGGELGEIPVTSNFKDFVLTIPNTGNSIQVRAVFKLTAESEELLIDNIRLKESEGDVTPLEVFDAYMSGPNTIDVVFQEDVNFTAEETFHYTGISGINSATIGADGQTVTLSYDSPFMLGNGYTLVVFAVQDLAGNAMSGSFQFTFYFNNTTPDLVITEIMYNDASAADSLEFIEIYNNGTATATIGGLMVEDGIDWILPSITLAPGEFILGAREPLKAQDYYGGTFYPYNGGLANTGELVELVNPLGVLIDSVLFDDDLPWPPEADGLGPSMELNSPNNDNSIGANWVASTNGLPALEDGSPVLATPGALPSIIVPTIQFFENTIEANEIDGTVEFLVSISGSNANPSVVEFVEIGGTASSPADLGASALSPVTFDPFSTDPQIVSVPIVNDTQNEGLEYYRLGISVLNNAMIGIKDTLLIVIADDEYISPDLYINELQADNFSDITDEAGDHDDWFEIYNPNFFNVDIAGYWVSDDPLNPTRDRMPIESTSTIIPPGGWLLAWADGEGSEGPLHFNFNLGAGGEFLSLYAPDGLAVVDSITFPALDTDLSYGREMDGDPNWVIFSNTTPGGMNSPDAVFEIKIDQLPIYPNPTRDFVFLNEITDFSIYNHLGILIQKANSNRIDVSNWPNGMYYIISESNHSARFIKY